jgi:3D (Asp-Asp-Asp) domain-containing protein
MEIPALPDYGQYGDYAAPETNPTTMTLVVGEDAVFEAYGLFLAERHASAPLVFAPHETRAIDIRKLRDAQEADFKNNKIPADASDGSVNWIRLDNVPVSGGLVVLKRHAGMVSGYHCFTCMCAPNFVGLDIDPESATLAVGEDRQYIAYGIDEDCNGWLWPWDVTWETAWLSYNPSVATVDWGLVIGEAGGSTTIRADYYGWKYQPDVVGECKPAFMIHLWKTSTANVQYPSITVTRQSLTSTSASGSPSASAGNPAFTYSATGSGNIASYATQNANANPNTASINAPANPGGVPTPGGLATLTATYHVFTGATAAKSFSVATFGQSCYITALESDYGDPTQGTCSTVTIKGTVYSGSSTNPSGLPARQYCNSFLGMVKLNGSGVLKDNTTKIQYSSGSYPNWVFRVVTAINGADNSPVVAGQTLARDRSIIPGINNTHVQLPSGTYLANDIGSDVTGYRLDIYTGVGKANCTNYPNPIVVGVCDHVTSTCPGYTIQ